MSTAESARELSFVEADLNYSVRTTEKPVSETYGRDGLERRYTGRFEKHRVRIADARSLRESLSLDANGFELADRLRLEAGNHRLSVAGVARRAAPDRHVSGAVRVVQATGQNCVLS